MENYSLGVEINVPGIEVCLMNLNSEAIVQGTKISRNIDTNSSTEDLITAWAEVIRNVVDRENLGEVRIGIAIPGPFDYEKGISLMRNQKKFDSLYNVNVKDMLALRLGIPTSHIRMSNNTPCYLRGELMIGAARGSQGVLAFTMNHGLGSAVFLNGEIADANLWNKPFKDGIAEDFLGVDWLVRRYKDFTGVEVSGIEELAELAWNEDGLGQLVFNEYGENFVKFLLQYLNSYSPELIIIGGNNNAWKIFIDHVKDRLGDKNINIPIKTGELGTMATLIGAAALWN